MSERRFWTCGDCGNQYTSPEGLQAHPCEAANWADPLSRTERAELARRLARACKRSYDARLGLSRPGSFDLAFGVVEVSAECSALHLDVTERAAVAST